MTAVDARELNWRFVVPGEPPGMIVLDRAAAKRHGRVGDALEGSTSPAIAVPDLSVWTAAEAPLAVLREVAASVSPGGWLCVGFPNRWFPRPTTGAAALRGVRATLHAAGLDTTAVFLPLPDQRHPALLVDARHRGQLDYVFRHVLLTYVPGSSVRARVSRRLLAGVRGVALVAPHALRVHLAPAYCVVARRSP